MRKAASLAVSAIRALTVLVVVGVGMGVGVLAGVGVGGAVGDGDVVRAGVGEGGAAVWVGVVWAPPQLASSMLVGRANVVARRRSQWRRVHRIGVSPPHSENSRLTRRSSVPADRRRRV